MQAVRKGFIIVGAAIYMALLLQCTEPLECLHCADGFFDKNRINGVAQKGPFNINSDITIYELDASMDKTGVTLRTSTDASGGFKKEGMDINSQYVLVEAAGRYKNEVSGANSNKAVTLYALADISERGTVNVNVLTHLEYFRVLHLLQTSAQNFQNAKKQAQGEILSAFGIKGNFPDSESISIFGTSESSAALLAVSILLLGNQNADEFSELLYNLSQNLAGSGAWTSDVEKASVADFASEADLSNIRYNIQTWGLSSEIPDFEKNVNSYWYSSYDLGTCGSSNDGQIKQNANANSLNGGVEYICNSGIWQKNFGTRECGGVEYIPPDQRCGSGNVIEDRCGTDWYNKLNTYLRCTSGVLEAICGSSWYNTNNQRCGSGNVIETKCGSGWYVANENLRCENDVVEKKCGNSWYIEDESSICENGVIKFCERFEQGEQKMHYGKLKKQMCDERDGKKYFYVNIDHLTWMAENLNYNSSGSRCYNDSESNCATYGRLYNYNTINNTNPCPSGWRIPDFSDLNNLHSISNGGYALKAQISGGSDQYGFSALMGGYYDGTFQSINNTGYWWISSSLQSFNMNLYNNDFKETQMNPNSLLSVRCVNNTF